MGGPTLPFTVPDVAHDVVITSATANLRSDGNYTLTFTGTTDGAAGTVAPSRRGSNARAAGGSGNGYWGGRRDGTTCLSCGAVGGGGLGNGIAPGGSKTIGSILGGSLGAILGKSIDGSNVTCR